MAKKKPKAVKHKPVPKGKFLTSDIVRMAKEKGLSINTNHVTERLRRIRDGKLPMPKGLEQDKSRTGHPFFFPKSFANSLLSEARRRKYLPALLESGRILPLAGFASQLGLQGRALLRYSKAGKFSTVMISGKHYVKAREAERFKKWYKENVAGTASSKGGKYRVQGGAPNGRKMSRKKIDPLVAKEVEWWLKEMLPLVTSSQKRDFMRRVVEGNRSLPYEEFRTRISPKIRKMFEG